MTLATNLDEVYRVCDPKLPLSATDSRYVDLSEVRSMSMLATNITRRILRCDQHQFHKQLISGHRGCGKSTELLRLKAELEAKAFLVVYFDVEELLDMVDLSYLDILLSIAKQTMEEMESNDINVNQALITDLYEWFSDKIVEDQTATSGSASLKTEAGVNAKMPFLTLLAKLTAEIKATSSRREITRKNLKRELNVFIERLNKLLLDARNAAKQANYSDLVLIVDGLEKMHFEQLDDDSSTHTRLFVDHAEQLTAPECHIVYTMPISLAYNANLGNDFDDPEVIPMIKMNDAGIACLRQVIAKRIDIEAVFDDPSSIDELARLSGGVMRDLIRLIRLTTDTDKATIGADEIQYAKTKLVMSYDRLLKNEELEQLRWIVENHRVTGDKEFGRMLNQRLILEYQNGERWADIHPALREISWVKEQLNADK